MALLFTSLYGIGGQGFLGLLTNEQTVIQVAGEYFYWVLAIPFAGFAAFLWDGILIGATATKQMLLAMIISATAFFLIYFLFSGATNNHILWLAFLIYLFSRGVMMTILGQKIFSVQYMKKETTLKTNLR